MNKFIIGVDIGTTGCRSVIYRQDGQILATSCAEYPLYTPFTGWAEQSADEIYQAVVTTIRRSVLESGLTPGEIAGLSFSSFFHSIMPVDSAGAALCPMLIWADSRSQHYTEILKQRPDSNLFYEKTSCPLHPMYPLSKLFWLKYERPDIFAKAVKFISIKEFIIFRLCGKYALDRSLASGTGLYNIKNLCWDKDILKLLEIDESRLAEVYSTVHYFPLTPQAAGLLALAADTPVILGAGDGVLSNLGAGAIHPGQCTAMIGTSGAVRVIVTEPLVDLKQRTWCYNLTDKYWVTGGAISNGGIAFRWLRDKLAEAEQQTAAELGIDSYDLLSKYAEQIPPGSDGLILLPFFAGERAPNWNANSRGIFFGLHMNHNKRHMIRAALEGIIYRMFSVYSVLEEVSGPLQEIRVSGSFTRSQLWLQIMADVFGKKICVPGEPQGSAFGAALLGFYALGIINDLRQVDSLISIQQSVLPIPKHHTLYQRLYQIYNSIYWKLQPEFAEIAAIQTARPE